MKKILGIGLLASVASASQAYVLFDFEEFNVQSGLTQLVSVQSGVTMTLSRTIGTFAVIDTQAALPNFPFPLTWDNRAISPFEGSFANDHFIANFSQQMKQVEIEFTDFGSDPDTVVAEFYSGQNATGTLIGTSTVQWGLNSSPNWVGAGLFTTSSAGIGSVKFRGGDGQSFPNSMYIDNIAANPVPEPATLAALGVGALALARRRRSK